jgi:energy-coupling factor transport system substrate-specific component
MVAIIAISGIIKGGWGQVRFITEAIFGPAATTVLGGFFIFWGMLAVFSIKKFGVGTLVMTLGTPFELAAGNPFGQMVWVYNFFEGLGADVAFGIFRYRFPKGRVGSLVVAGVVGAVNSLISYLVFGITLNLFSLPLIANLISMATSAFVSIFWGMFAFGIYGTLQRVRAVPPEE